MADEEQQDMGRYWGRGGTGVWGGFEMGNSRDENNLRETKYTNNRKKGWRGNMGRCTK